MCLELDRQHFVDSQQKLPRSLGDWSRSSFPSLQSLEAPREHRRIAYNKHLSHGRGV